MCVKIMVYSVFYTVHGYIPICKRCCTLMSIHCKCIVITYVNVVSLAKMLAAVSIHFAVRQVAVLNNSTMYDCVKQQ